MCDRKTCRRDAGSTLVERHRDADADKVNAESKDGVLKAHPPKFRTELAHIPPCHARIPSGRMPPSTAGKDACRHNQLWT
jgi:hypothetical protein